MEKIGLIAGKTDFPVIFAKAAKAKGLYVVAVGIEGETKPDVSAVADKFF